MDYVELGAYHYAMVIAPLQNVPFGPNWYQSMAKEIKSKRNARLAHFRPYLGRFNALCCDGSQAFPVRFVYFRPLERLNALPEHSITRQHEKEISFSGLELMAIHFLCACPLLSAQRFVLLLPILRSRTFTSLAPVTLVSNAFRFDVLCDGKCHVR